MEKMCLWTFYLHLFVITYSNNDSTSYKLECEIPFNNMYQK